MISTVVGPETAVIGKVALSLQFIYNNNETFTVTDQFYIVEHMTTIDYWTGKKIYFCDP